MNIDQARGLLNQIESLLFSGSQIEHFLRHLFNEIPTKVVDERFVEALAKLHALGALDAELSDFISIFIRSQIDRFYNQLCKTRRWHLIHGHVYTYANVLHFVNESQMLMRLLRKKIEKCHAESCKVSEEFSECVVNCGTGVLVRGRSRFNILVTKT